MKKLGPTPFKVLQLLGLRPGPVPQQVLATPEQLLRQQQALDNYHNGIRRF